MDRILANWREEVSLSVLNDLNEREFRGAVLASLRRGRQGPHAFSDQELADLLDLLRPRQAPEMEDLRQWTDEFAVLVGLSLRATPTSSSGEQIADFEVNLLRPASELWSALQRTELRKSLLVPWGKLQDFHFGQLERLLDEFIELSGKQVQAIKDCEKLGHPWHSELVAHHVYFVGRLCEQINPDLDLGSAKSRGQEKQRFMKIVDLLATPLFEPDVKFRAAVEKYLDDQYSAHHLAEAEVAGN